MFCYRYFKKKSCVLSRNRPNTTKNALKIQKISLSTMLVPPLNTYPHFDSYNNIINEKIST